ncbi:unnamed protein product [Didymodactylos carnosus]|nr:unnamed protein product [Didymodactylos carnosus]CAF4061634.1 unnamed protein product [Didymodactylos carnosus]
MENRQSNELSNKLRLLTTYSEHVVWVCPLTTNNLMAKNKLIIPLPLISDIYFHRCINMKDILKSKYYQEFFIDCFQTIKQYENRISKIDFPLDIESPSLLNNHPRYKKRSQSEFYYEPIVISNSLEKSNNHYSYSSENINNNISNNRLFYCASSSSSSSSLSVHNYSNEKIKMNDSLQYRDSFEKIKEKLSNSMNYHEQNSQTNNRSYYSRIKLDNSINSLKYRSRKKSIPQIDDNFKRSPFIQHKIIEDTNYNDIDQLYDYIRTGIMSNNILQIMNLSTENLSNNNNEQYYDANESYKTDNSEYSINKIKIDNVMYISQSPKKMRINNDLKQNSPILISKKQHQKSKVNSTTLDVEHEILVNKNKTKSRRFSKYNGNQSLNSITNNIVEKTKKQNYNNVSLENIDFQSCTEYKIDDDSNKVKKYKKQQHEQQQQQPSIRQHPQTEALVTYTTSARKNKIEPKVINLIDENDRNMSAKSSNSKKIYYRV